MSSTMVVRCEKYIFQYAIGQLLTALKSYGFLNKSIEVLGKLDAVWTQTCFWRLRVMATTIQQSVRAIKNETN